MRVLSILLALVLMAMPEFSSGATQPRQNNSTANSGINKDSVLQVIAVLYDQPPIDFCVPRDRVPCICPNPLICDPNPQPTISSPKR